jgi:hypothetical protein
VGRRHVSSESGSGDEASADGLRATAWKLVEDSWAVSRCPCSFAVPCMLWFSARLLFQNHQPTGGFVTSFHHRVCMHCPC